MPTYCYECQECGHRQDENHRMSEEPDLECGECGSGEMERKMVPPNFKVRGGTPTFHN